MGHTPVRMSGWFPYPSLSHAVSSGVGGKELLSETVLFGLLYVMKIDYRACQHVLAL